MDQKIIPQSAILKLHTKLLQYLLVWPQTYLTNRQNYYFTHALFYFSFCCAIPVASAAIYQFSVGIEDAKVLIEALIGNGDIFGYSIAYHCFLMNQKKIQKLMMDFVEFEKFCGPQIIKNTEEKMAKYTKIILSYVTGAVILNFVWQMLSLQSCIIQRGSEFYIKHDPCGFPVRNMYPFDANGKYFWIVYPIEVVYAYHITCFFSLATTTIMGFLMHISTQLNFCANQFERLFDDLEDLEISRNFKVNQFTHLIKYHQKIIIYANRVFKVFDSLIGVYIGFTSILISVLGYQMVNSKINTSDRIKYFMLLIGWSLLIFMICYNGQKVQDDALKIGQSIFKSEWYKYGIAVRIKYNLIFAIARTQKPLLFKSRFLGSISLLQFMRVMKWAYSGLTLLIAVTDDD